MKYLIGLIAIIAVACSKRNDGVPVASGESVLRFSKDTVFVRRQDSLNINNTGNGMFLVYTNLYQHQLNLMYSEPSGRVHLSYRGVVLGDSQPFVVAADSSGLFCYVDTPGIYTVDFYLTDQLGRVVTRSLVIKCTSGEKPVANLTFQQVNIVPDNFQYFFNGSGSVQPYGRIVSYNYVIGGDTVVTNRAILKWFFHSSGVYLVDFWVIDDLNVSSDTLHHSIVIP